MTGQDAIVAEIEVAAPPERVFAALIDPQQLMQWWGGEGRCKKRLWQIDARVGGQWRSESYDPTGKVAINGISDSMSAAKLSNTIRHACWPIPGLRTGTASPVARRWSVGS
jgi:uncharacterized protein YndB with AHSA1/START domain